MSSLDFNLDDLTPEERQMFDEMVYEEMQKIEDDLQHSTKTDDMGNGRNGRDVYSVVDNINSSNRNSHGSYAQEQVQQQNQQLSIRNSPIRKDMSVDHPFSKSVDTIAYEMQYGRPPQGKIQPQQHLFQHVDRSRGDGQGSYRVEQTQDDVVVKVPQRSHQASPNQYLIEEQQRKKDKQAEYARQIEKDIAMRLAKKDHVRIDMPAKVQQMQQVQEGYEEYQVGRRDITEHEKRMKQQLYAQQLQQQRHEKEIGRNEQHRVTSSSAAYDSQHSEESATSLMELKKEKQRRYFEELQYSSSAAPIQDDRISLVAIRRGNREVGGAASIASHIQEESTSTSLPIGQYQHEKDDKQLRKQRQLQYSQQLQDCISLPPIPYSLERQHNPKFEVAKQRKAIIASVHNIDGGQYAHSTVEDDGIAAYIKKKQQQEEYAMQLKAASTKVAPTSPRVQRMQQREGMLQRDNHDMGAYTSLQIGTVDTKMKKDSKEQYARLLYEDMQRSQQQHPPQQDSRERARQLEVDMEYRNKVMEEARKQFELKFMKSSMPASSDYYYDAGSLDRGGYNAAYNPTNYGVTNAGPIISASGSNNSNRNDSYMYNDNNTSNSCSNNYSGDALSEPPFRSVPPTTHAPYSDSRDSGIYDQRSSFRTRGYSQGGGPSSFSIGAHRHGDSY